MTLLRKWFWLLSSIEACCQASAPPRLAYLLETRMVVRTNTDSRWYSLNRLNTLGIKIIAGGVAIVVLSISMVCAVWIIEQKRMLETNIETRQSELASVIASNLK